LMFGLMFGVVLPLLVALWLVCPRLHYRLLTLCPAAY